MPSAIIRPVNWGKRTCQPCLKCSKSSGGADRLLGGQLPLQDQIDDPAGEPGDRPPDQVGHFGERGHRRSFRVAAFTRESIEPSAAQVLRALRQRQPADRNRGPRAHQTALRHRGRDQRHAAGGAAGDASGEGEADRRGAEAVAGGEPRQGAEGREAR